MNRRKFINAAALSGMATALPASQLFAAPQNEKPVIRFAHITDIHVKPGIIPEKGMANVLHHVQQLTPKVEFIINGGDSIMDALDADKAKAQTQFDLYKKILQQNNSLPIYHTIGNHDIWGWFTKENALLQQDKLYGKSWVVEEFSMPKRYYRFKKNNWHFIVLDSTQLNPDGGYIGKLDDEQFEWLRQELASTPANEFICIISHIPILSICAGLFFDKTEDNGDLKIKRNLMHSDFLHIKKLFVQHPQIRVCISGHIHLQDKVEYLGVQYFCNGAVCGNWWSGAFQEFAPAYAIMELYEDGTANRTIITYT